MSTGTYRVKAVLHVIENSWREGVKQDILSALQPNPEVQIDFADPQGDAAEQDRILARFLDEGIDALILWPIDTLRTRAVLERYLEAKIPVILLDNDIGAPHLYRTLISCDNHRLGLEVGKFFVDAMGGEGDLVEIRGLVDTAAARDRSAGFREAFAGHPGMRVVDECIGDWQYKRALREFGEVLTRQPALDGVFAQSDDMAHGALDAALKVGREAEMLVVGIDAVPAAIHRVTEGRQAATFLNPSPGKNAVYALLELLKGEACLPRVLLRSWPYRSNGRIQDWQKARALRRGDRGRPAEGA